MSGEDAATKEQGAAVGPASMAMRFDRVELAGALGDLGTLLPIVIAMILINGLSVSAVFLAFGSFYVLAGLYYRLPIPVQPLKAVGAIAIANAAVVDQGVIAATGIIFGALMLFLAVTGLVDRLAKLFTAPVVRGIQLGLGLIFLRKGILLIASDEVFLGAGRQGLEQAQVQAQAQALTLGGGYALPYNTIIGVAVFALVLFLLDNKRMPAAIAALAVGIGAGLALGGHRQLGLELELGPTPMAPVIPPAAAWGVAAVQLVLPQIPLTIGNACVGTADTTRTLFPDHPALGRAKAGRFALSMGVVNLPAGFVGAIPMCHGTGGLAAHYRFGARTGGAPVMIGVLFLVLALGLGRTGLGILSLIPNGVLGVLLVFAGLELAPLIKDLKQNEERFVAILVAGIALAIPNMAWAFLGGMAADIVIRKGRITI